MDGLICQKFTLQLRKLQRLSANWATEIGLAPLVQAILMEDMPTNGFSHPLVFKLQQAHRTTIIL